jgi:selenocysteine lyase/cysteine desulfurase
VRHPLSLVKAAQDAGFRVLLDVAAFLPTSALSLRKNPADFVALSIYKIAGYPTGVGALIARRDALEELDRPWFAGGTVEYASVQHGSHMLRAHNGEGFEDGTPAFLSIAAVKDGLDFLEDIGMNRINRHVAALTIRLVRELEQLERRDGGPLVRIYGGECDRGGTIAFNVLDSCGRAIPFARVVHRARDEGVSLRGGCFCNPGAAEAALEFPFEGSRKCFARAAHDGFSIEKLSACLGRDTAVGAVRASIGMPTNTRDLDRALSVIRSFA